MRVQYVRDGLRTEVFATCYLAGLIVALDSLYRNLTVYNNSFSF
jgi:hypothetical protein